MSLRLIYGRAGTGKSQFCFNEISNKINEENKIYVITPDQFSFTSGQKLLNSLNKEAVLNADVLTFNRMAYRVASEVRRINKSKSFKIWKSYANIQHISISKRWTQISK